MTQAELYEIKRLCDVAELPEISPIRRLVAEVERLQAELDECRRVCESLAERCVGQSELLSKRAEKDQ